MLAAAMASPAPRIADPQALESLPTLPDDYLEEIFLRLSTAEDITRASASCTNFRRIITGRSFLRRIITGRSFLRRFRAKHPPPLLGFAAYEGFHPAQAPHPSATLARAFADAADFSYSFVPTGRWRTPWHPRDVRQGRVLLECTPECEEPALEYFDAVSLRDLELAVCDPLSRRYRLLPHIPKPIRAQHGSLVDYGLFFAPTGEDEDTAFRVVCMASNKTKLVAFEYMSTTGQWNIHACLSWRSSLHIGMPYSRYSSSCLDYENGCFHWIVPWGNKLLVLDGLSMKLSTVKQNPFKYGLCESGKPLIVRGGDGTVEVFFLVDCFGDGPTDLIRFTKQNDGGSDEWEFENMISLPTHYGYFTLGAADGFLFLRSIMQDQDSGYSSEDSSDNSAHLSVELPDVEYFSCDLKTSKLEKICVMKHCFHTVYPYYGYPPPLAEPTV